MISRLLPYTTLFRSLPVSSAEYYEIPTSERVKDALASSGYRCAMDPEEAMRLARGTVEWVMASDDDSDYMANLRAVAASDEVSDRHVGILARSEERRVGKGGRGR